VRSIGSNAAVRHLKRGPEVVMYIDDLLDALDAALVRIALAKWKIYNFTAGTPNAILSV
jgi:hypothetical protein